MEGSPHEPLTDTSTDEQYSEPQVVQVELPEPKRPRANFADISESMGNVFTGIVLLALSGVRLYSRLMGRQSTLPQPRDHEIQDVAEPLARIAARHAPVEFASDVANDFLDAASAMGAMNALLDNNRMPSRMAVDTSIPTEGVSQ